MSEKKYKPLSALAESEKGLIRSYTSKGLLKQKLYNMGFIPGAEVLMVRTAPLMDPIEVLIQNYHVSIRKEEAAIIEVETHD